MNRNYSFDFVSLRLSKIIEKIVKLLLSVIPLLPAPSPATEK